MNIIDSALNKPVRLQQLTHPVLAKKRCSVFVLRLDELHPKISGNKLFKLKYFLEEALTSVHKTIITFGGAYSNHLLATAAACRLAGLRAIGIVRGEKVEKLSHTLQECESYGMTLKFLSRTEYVEKSSPSFISGLRNEFGEFVFIPEGGASPAGARGAELIAAKVKDTSFTHICCAAGTGTTAAGLASLQNSITEILVFPVLKGLNNLREMIHSYLTGGSINNYKIIHDYNFGGYAKKTPELIEFMNQFYINHGIPSDFVYTGKMFFGIWDMLCKNYFAFNSKILCIHTGGLQGNLSLPPGTLAF